MKKCAFIPTATPLGAGLMLVLTIAACSAKGADGAATTSTDFAADSAAISGVAKTYQDAYNRKDVAAVVATYADDAVEVVPNGKLIKGKADLTAFMTSDTANWGKLTITPNEPVAVSGNLAWGSGTTVAQVPGPGGQMMSIPGSYIVVLRKDAAAWKVAALSGVPDSAAVASLMQAAAAASKTGKK